MFAKITKKIKNIKGITLVEVLVTIFILSLIFIFSFQSLSVMITTREIVPKDVNFINDIERVFDRIEYDFVNASLISPVAPNGARLTPIMVGKEGVRGALATLTISKFTSGDYNNQDGQLIGYRLINNNLEILIWQTLYLAQVDEVANPKVYTLLENVEDFKVSVQKNRNSEWVLTYPIDDAPDVQNPNSLPSSAYPNNVVAMKQNYIDQLPIGLKVEIKIKNNSGIYTRIFNRPS